MDCKRYENNGNRGTYRVQQDHTLVHYFKVVGHQIEVISKLIEQVLNFSSFNLNNERVG